MVDGHFESATYSETKYNHIPVIGHNKVTLVHTFPEKHAIRLYCAMLQKDSYSTMSIDIQGLKKREA